MNIVAEADRIRVSSLGQELDKQECKELASIMGVLRLHDGEILVKEGEANDNLFLLVEGKLSVVTTVEDKEVAVYTLNPGECAGTRAFVDGTARKATLRALGDATVYTLKPDEFESLLETHPRIVYKVMRALFRITHVNLMRMNLESQELRNYISKTHGRY